MKLYKVLNKDLTSPFQNFQFEIGKEYSCLDFDEDITKDCSRGYYATDLNGLIYSFNINKKVFECEVKGKRVEIDKYKRRYENITLKKEIFHIELKQLLKTDEINKKEGFNYIEAMFPINPLLIKSKKVTTKDIELLKVWDSVRASVRDSVRDSVRASVWASVGDSVRDSVRASVRDSVGDSVWDSVWAYISSLFPNIKQWKHAKHKEGINPYQSCVDLWKSGFIPSYDGKTWMLHSNTNAKIVFQESFQTT